MRIALAHDSFTQMGGAERVIEALHELYPQAPVFTLVFDPKFREKYRGWDIRTSGLQTVYLGLGKMQYLLPLIPWGVDNLDLSGFDLIISSSSGFVKNIRAPKGAVHINYCHTPARFLWGDKEAYIKEEVPFILRPMVRILLNRIKDWDLRGAQRVTKFIANSQEVKTRIQYYQRTSEVIHPPVDTEFWRPTKPKAGYFLLAGRLQAHKKNDFIIKIFNELGRPLRVVGTGRQEGYLRTIAKPNITFLGKITDEQLRDEYSGASGYIFPQLEDFGLMPLEAAACGTATLAYGRGGALETILPGVTGEFFNSYDSDKVKKMILNWQPEKYTAEGLRSQAEKFSKENFKENIKNFIANENRH